jgi:hypothetical protein
MQASLGRRPARCGAKLEKITDLPHGYSDEGDMAGAETWHRILNAIERLQAKAPAEGVH